MAKRWVALLRAVNLGATNRVAMRDLRALLESLGATDVGTYLQSGNVVFDKMSTTAAALERRISNAVGVPVFVRSGAELRKIVNGNPFDTGMDTRALRIAFLSAPAPRSRVNKIEPDQFRPDEFVVRGKVIYLRYPYGQAGRKMSNAFFEERLGVFATTRSWSTVIRLADMATSGSHRPH